VIPFYLLRLLLHSISVLFVTFAKFAGSFCWLGLLCWCLLSGCILLNRLRLLAISTSNDFINRIFNNWASIFAIPPVCIYTRVVARVRPIGRSAVRGSQSFLCIINLLVDMLNLLKQLFTSRACTVAELALLMDLAQWMNFFHQLYWA
jgi:hypothetical protein